MAARKLGVVLMIVYAAAGPASVRGAGPSVQVVPKEAAGRVDVLGDGQPFTSYIWPTSVKKPVLFPIRTGRGAVVPRGFPLEPRPREHTDHPHHVGLWLNYGDVNGVDFWGNSGQASEPGKMGIIVHRKVESAKGGDGRGELAARADWKVEGGRTLLLQRTRYVFRAAPALRRTYPV